jgi:hypothetical protein
MLMGVFIEGAMNKDAEVKDVGLVDTFAPQ